jgi:hypothetical protein
MTEHPLMLLLLVGQPLLRTRNLDLDQQNPQIHSQLDPPGDLSAWQVKYPFCPSP